MSHDRIETFRSSELPRADQINGWSRFVSDTFARSVADRAMPKSFDAQVSRMQIGSIGLAWMSLDAMDFDVDVASLGEWSSSEQDVILLSLQEAGNCVGQYPAGTLAARPGDMVLIDTSLSPRWRFISKEPTRSLMVKLPASRIMGMIGDTSDLCGRRLEKEIPSISLASSLLSSVRCSVEAHPDEDWSGYEDLLVEIVVSALSGQNRFGPSRPGRTLRRKACTLIERHLDDADLNPAALALSLGTSVRTLHRVFAEVGSTPNGYVLSRRITVAARLLRDQPRTTITTIALSVGFNDPNYFSRSFKEMMGVSPRDYRRPT